MLSAAWHGHCSAGSMAKRPRRNRQAGNAQRRNHRAAPGAGYACDHRSEHGPFDIIGDVHGCFAELAALLEKLGYELEYSGPAGRISTARHPQQRRAVFLGDLVDRGPDTPGVLRLAMGMVRSGTALCLLGNHDSKLLKALQGRNVRIAHGLGASLDQLAQEIPAFRAAVERFLGRLPSHYLLDSGRLVAAHAGLKEELQGECSRRARGFALYGQTTGETDEYGLPVRLDWAQEYHGQAYVVYGHTPVLEPVWVNRTIDIDTGCVFGGALTALRYPEMELVQEPARRMYYEPVRPLPARIGA